MRAKQQRILPFDGKREQDRLDKIERLWGDHPKVKTAAVMFDEENQRKAEQAAKGVHIDTPGGKPA